MSQSLVQNFQQEQFKRIPARFKTGLKQIQQNTQKGTILSTKEFKDEVRKLLDSGYEDSAVDGSGHAVLANMWLKFVE